MKKAKAKRGAGKRTRLRSILGHEYPVGESLARVKRAGGLHRMSAEQIASLTIKRVPPGGWCDDIPEECRAVFLRRGKIEEVEVNARGVEKAGGKRKAGS